MLFELTAWEDNGYNDSDFFSTYWDTESRKVVSHETGSTRYAGGMGNPAGYAGIISDPAMLEDAIAWLAEHIFGVIRVAELRDVLEPNDAAFGVELRTIRNVRSKEFGVIPAGTVGEVFWSGAFGKFYAKGYNKPCRANIRVGLRLLDGRRVFVALSACRLNREPLSDVELRERAAGLARYCGFSAASGRKFTWDSKNYALAVLTASTKKIAA